MGKYREEEKRLELLSSGEDAAWKQFYNEMRRPFQFFFLKKGGLDEEKTIELFQEAMIIFHRNVRSGKLTAPLNSTLKTYLIGIGKMLYRKLGEATNSNIDEIPEIPVAPQIEIADDWREKAVLVRSLLNRIGQPCKQLLELIYIQRYVMEAVVAEMDFPSEGAARKRKFDCLKKLRSMI